jgi:exodeoxyribonuclease VII large subunit
MMIFNDKKKLFQAMLSFHQERWFKVIINEISAEFTIWVLKQHQQDIAAILNQEGIFDKNKSRILPTPSRNIAVITWENSQWFIDFETVLKESDYKAFNIIPFFCAIHWNNASDEVYDALKTVFNRISSWEKIDLVILLRGGWWGSGFVRQNAIWIARWICHMPVPVITAIWHTSDISILDDISRYSAKTPTDAAYKIIDSLADRESQLESALSQVSLLSRDIFWAMMQRVHWLLQNIKELAPQKILTYKTEITRTFETIMMLWPDKMLNRWYWLIMDENWKILKKEKSDLQEGQTLKIKRYGKIITVTVEEILN